MSYVCSKEEVVQEANEIISDLQKKEGEFLTIDGDPVYEEDHLFEEGMYFSVFYCLFLLTIDQQIFWRDS